MLQIENLAEYFKFTFFFFFVQVVTSNIIIFQEKKMLRAHL